MSWVCTHAVQTEVKAPTLHYLASSVPCFHPQWTQGMLGIKTTRSMPLTAPHPAGVRTTSAEDEVPAAAAGRGGDLVPSSASRCMGCWWIRPHTLRCPPIEVRTLPFGFLGDGSAALWLNFARAVGCVSGEGGVGDVVWRRELSLPYSPRSRLD
jgi:hypothetical protein